MKKKNLIILLLMPFLISIFCIITINATYNMVDVDISGIDWSYKDMEGFRLNQSHKLTASAVNQRNYKVSGGNELIWTVENKDQSDPDPCAEIVQEGSEYYLRPIKEGEVIITCSNEKGNVQRRLSAVIYLNSALMLYPEISASQTNIDKTIYYGEFDHTHGNVAKIKMNLVAIGLDRSKLDVETTDNVKYDLATDTITVSGIGPASVTVTDKSGSAKPTSFSFHIVDEGINVYTYQDLLYCTNTNSKSGGYIAVLRKHFESLENVYKMSGNYPAYPLEKKTTANNVECFGNYNPATRSFSFIDEIHHFTTTYNRSFIDSWNEFAKNNKDYSAVTDQINVGLHVQKDFYGNGYTINLHNLTYPYSHSEMTNDAGDVVRIPVLTSQNLFRGPLKLYSLGDPNNVPLVSLYGQDNIGMYVEGNGITVNDVVLKNCDFGDRMANLDTVGTVLENFGHNNTVKNCNISNGKNVVRSFSSHNFTLDNSILSNARNFLFVTGSNEYKQVDLSKKITLPNLNGGKVQMSLEEFLAADAEGDLIINEFIMESFDTPEGRKHMTEIIGAIQDALNDVGLIATDYKGSAVINDTYFYRSGITAICMESMFNSPFLETASAPSLITKMFTMLQSEGKTLVPFTPKGVSGVSYPVTLEVTGNSRFYDYKEVGKIDLDGLIEENISDVANSSGLYEGSITIDDIFPLQKLLNRSSHVYSAEGKRYYNIPVAYYGGGLNLSKVTMRLDKVSAKVNVDLLDEYLRMKGSSTGGSSIDLRGLMLKTVISVTGFEPFAFHFVTDGYLYGQNPNLSDLVNMAKTK